LITVARSPCDGAPVQKLKGRKITVGLMRVSFTSHRDTLKQGKDSLPEWTQDKNVEKESIAVVKSNGGALGKGT